MTDCRVNGDPPLPIAEVALAMGGVWECVTAGCKAFSLANGK